MACLRRAPLEGHRGDVSCDEEGCQFRRVALGGGTNVVGETSQADCVLQLRLRAGDVAKLGLRHDEQDPDNPTRQEVERNVGIIKDAQLHSISLDAEPGPGGGHIVSVGEPVRELDVAYAESRESWTNGTQDFDQQFPTVEAFGKRFGYLKPDGWTITQSDIDQLVQLLRLKPWQRNRVEYWLDHLRGDV